MVCYRVDFLHQHPHQQRLFARSAFCHHLLRFSTNVVHKIGHSFIERDRRQAFDEYPSRSIPALGCICWVLLSRP
jgi:hypothetical protein